MKTQRVSPKLNYIKTTLLGVICKL